MLRLGIQSRVKVTTKAGVQRGAKPFVLAGATGGVLRWEPSGNDDPWAMVHDELPDGRHTRRYWNRCTPSAFGFLATELNG